MLFREIKRLVEYRRTRKMKRVGISMFEPSYVCIYVIYEVPIEDLVDFLFRNC